MAQILKEGDAVPAFKVKDFEGELVSNEDLIGSPFIIYFYPENGTKGCTEQACNFRDDMDAFEELDILVVGVSHNDMKSHNKFMEENELNFPLFSDPDLSMAKAFGATQTVDGKEQVVRSTFLFDEDGNLVWSESPVNVVDHVERVLEAVEDAFA